MWLQGLDALNALNDDVVSASKNRPNVCAWDELVESSGLSCTLASQEWNMYPSVFSSLALGVLVKNTRSS
jgi:hypothetical protein